MLNKYGGNYENMVILEDFEVQPANEVLETFLEDSGFVNLMKSKTCFKSKAWNCIDLILTNNPKGFQNTGAMKTGVSNHHALIVSFLKTTFRKMPPNKLKHINYKLLEQIHS